MLKKRKHFFLETLENRNMLTVSAAAGGPYFMYENDSLTLNANPAQFILGSSESGNGAALQNEFNVDALLITVLPLTLDTPITGDFVADLDYSGGVLQDVQFNDGNLVVADVSANVTVGTVASITVTLTGVTGRIFSTAEESVTPDGNEGGSINLANTYLELNTGTVDVAGTGLAADLSVFVDLTTDPTLLDLSAISSTATLTVDPSDIGTLEVELNDDLLDFLAALVPPEDLAPLALYISGTFAIDATGSVDISESINPPAYTYSWDINGDSIFGDATGADPTLSWGQLNALGITDEGVFNVSVQVSDGMTTVTSSPTTLTVARPVVADAGGDYRISEGGSLTLSANPTTFNLSASGVGNAGLLQSELLIDGLLLGAVPFTLNTDLTGSFSAAVNYSGGVLSNVQLHEGAIDIGDVSSLIDLGSGNTISINFANVGADLYSVAPEAVVPDGNAGGTVDLTNSFLFLNSGTASIIGTGIFSTVNESIDLNVDPAEVPIGTLPDDAVLTVDGNNIGTFEYELSGDILTFLQGLLDPTLYSQIAALLSGTFGIDITGTADLSDAINPANWTYSWDLNNDSLYGDADGSNPTLTWSQLEALGFTDNGTYPVSLRVSDGLTTIFSTPGNIVVANAAPTASISTPVLDLYRGETVDFTLTATDPASADQAANFTFGIDWDGDNIVDETVVGPSGTIVSHTFSTVGSVNVQVSATDKDAGESALTLGPTVNTAIYQLRTNGAVDDLYWGGSDSAEAMAVNTDLTSIVEFTDGITSDYINGVTGDVKIFLNGGNDLVLFFGPKNADIYGGVGEDVIGIQNATNGTYNIYGGADADGLFLAGANGATLNFFGDADADIILIQDGLNLTVNMDGGDGNDFLLYLPGVTTVVSNLDGGLGDDIVVGGQGSDSLVGGDGMDIIMGSIGGVPDSADTLIGNDGNDVLIGQGGADFLDGGAGEDLLLAGELDGSYYADDPFPGVAQVWVEWQAPDPIATRKDRLTGVLPGTVLDPMFVLTPGSTIFDDGAVDTLTGGAGDADWFLYDAVDDVLTDFGGGDLATLI